MALFAKESLPTSVSFKKFRKAYEYSIHVLVNFLETNDLILNYSISNCMCQKEKNTSVPSKSAAAFLRLSPLSLPGRDCKHERKTQNNIVQSPQVTSYSLVTDSKVYGTISLPL